MKKSETTQNKPEPSQQDVCPSSWDHQLLQEMILSSVNKQSLKLKEKENSQDSFSSQQSFYDQMSESESNDSSVSFEGHLLDQHKYCLQFVLQNFKSSFFKQLKIDKHLQLLENISTDCMTLDQYLQSQEWQVGTTHLHVFKKVYEREYHLRKFLKWIYAYAPQVILAELIHISKKIVVYYEKYQGTNQQPVELLQIASSRPFIWSLYNDDSLQIFHYKHYYKLFQNSQYFEIGSVPQLMVFYPFTLMLILENYFYHPFHGTFQQLLRRQKEQQSAREVPRVQKLSKKIKKEKKLRQ